MRVHVARLELEACFLCSGIPLAASKVSAKIVSKLPEVWLKNSAYSVDNVFLDMNRVVVHFGGEVA